MHFPFTADVESKPWFAHNTLEEVQREFKFFPPHANTAKDKYGVFNAEQEKTSGQILSL